MKAIFSIFSLFLVFSCFCQKDRLKNDSIAILNVPVKNVHLRPLAFSNNGDSLPFNNITCYDVRQDTSCLGVIETDLKRRIVLAPSTSDAIANCLNTGFATRIKTTGNLHLYVKKLRLILCDSVPKTLDAPFQLYKLSVVIECYLELNEKYYPAFRIDSTFISRKDEVENTSSALIPFTTLLSEKCLTLNTSKIIKRNSYKASEISNRYRKQNHPQPVRGLYRSLSEFQRNTPSVLQFTAKYKDHNFDFTGKKDSLIYHSDVFIYCDGNNAWIYAGGQYCPLIRKGDRFEFYQYEWKYSRVSPIDLNNASNASPATAAATTGAAVAVDLLLSGNYVSKRKYHYLDIDTGEIY
jgi:hypothetical protein